MHANAAQSEELPPLSTVLGCRSETMLPEEEDALQTPTGRPADRQYNHTTVSNMIKWKEQKTRLNVSNLATLTRVEVGCCWPPSRSRLQDPGSQFVPLQWGCLCNAVQRPGKETYLHAPRRELRLAAADSAANAGSAMGASQLHCSAKKQFAFNPRCVTFRCEESTGGQRSQELATPQCCC